MSPRPRRGIHGTSLKGPIGPAPFTRAVSHRYRPKHSQRTPLPPPRWPRYGQIGAILCFVLALAGLAGGIMPGALERLEVPAANGPFTELYFANPERLPKLLHAGESLNFAFGLVNRQPSAETYDAAVTLVTGDERVALSNYRLTVSPNQSAYVPVTAKVDLAGRSTVEVALSGRPESIRFHVGPRVKRDE